ncbi:MAG: hypothetical protein AAGL49_06340, partial [Pseudomonadota bacterium]
MTEIVFAPTLPVSLIVALAAAAAVLFVYGVLRRARGSLWRGLAAAAVLALIAEPHLRESERERSPDIAAVIIDRSASQTLGQRAAVTDAAADRLQQSLSADEDLEVRVAEAVESQRGTELAQAIETALIDAP